MRKFIAALFAILVVCACGKATNDTGTDVPVVKEGAKKVTFTLVAAVVKKNGEVLPAARRQITFVPYNLLDVKRQLEVTNGVPPNPDPNDLLAIKAARLSECFDQCKGYTTPSIALSCYKRCGDAEAFLAKVKEHKAWEDAYKATAYVGLEEAIAKANPSKIAEEKVITGINGEAQVTLSEGTWYAWGDMALTNSAISWQAVPVVVKEGMNKFDLANDNGIVY